MSKFLITYYPLKPWRSFLCFEMNEKIQEDKNGDAWLMYEEYKRGLEKYKKKEGELFYFNESAWLMVEADTAFLAIERFYDRVREEAKKLEGKK